MREVRAGIVGGVLVLMGVALGAIAFGSEPAGAQASGYRTCVFGHQETHDIDGEGRWERGDRNFQGDRIIHIPSGWEVVSSGGGITQNGTRHGILMICRR